MDRREFLKTMTQAAAVAAASRVVPAAAEPPRRLTMTAAGDCIIARKISGRRDPDFLAIVELLRGADCAWGNCEMVYADSREVYPAAKGFDPHTICPPWGADELAFLGIDFVGTANNHIVDYGYEGLFATLANLERVGIAHAGSGADLAEAAKPGYVDTPAGRVGQVNCASTFLPFFAAGPAHPYLRGRPGLNPLRVDQRIQVDRALFAKLDAAQKTIYELQGLGEFVHLIEELFGKIPEGHGSFGDTQIVAGDGLDVLSQANPRDVERVAEAIRAARNNSRLVVASIHSHEARKRLSNSDSFLQPFAHACIDAGASAFFSAGPHVVRGIEIYKGKPIFHSLGNFVFQYESIQPLPAESFALFGLEPRTLDPWAFNQKIPYHQEERFWQSFVPRITFEDDRVTAIEIHPITLGFGQPVHERGLPALARGEKAREILEKIAELSRPYGTTIEIADGVGHVSLAGALA
jgi:poly-gamma-glutamate synthesis protein (capsule biosynthesis protein)